MVKILVIEDEEIVRESLLELLELRGYEVKGAHNGAVGIQVAFDFLPDLIISDIMMPEYNGFEVLETLRNSSETATTPFIFLTAKAEKDDIRHGMELGADDFLTKPFAQKDLYSAIDARLDRHSAHKNKANLTLNELKKSLSATIPHEFRTPLNGILATSQLLQQEGENMDSEEANQFHTLIYNSALRLNNLVSNYLLSSELDLYLVQDDEITKLRTEITNNVEDILKQTFEERASNFQRYDDLNLDIDCCDIFFRPEYFYKICQELSDNAFKFSSKGDTVNVKTRIVNDNFEMTIYNKGIGLNPAHLGKFSEFKQFDRGKNEQQGAGLGISIINKLCDIYNVDVNYSSEENNYFQVKLKIQKHSQ